MKEGQADPHWDYIARSDDPKFKPRPAVVTQFSRGVGSHNDPQRSQWISESRSAVSLPHNVTYTFRTTFELDRLTLQSAVIRGKFLADNLVQAIRLNGKEAPLPKFNKDNPFNQFYQFTEFFIKQDFVEGKNSLEIDVFNGFPSNPPHRRKPDGAAGRIGGFLSISKSIAGNGEGETCRPAVTHHPRHRPESKGAFNVPEKQKI